MNKFNTDLPSKKSSSKRVPFSIVIISLAFAVAMLLSSAIFADKGYPQTINFLLIAIWFVPFFYLIKVKKQ